MKKESGWNKFWLNPWFGGMVILAFASFILIMHSMSYSAEVKKQQTLWLVIGILSGVAAAFCLYKANKTSTGQGG